MHKKDETHHHHKPSEERSISGEVKVHGGVQVFSTESAINQHNAEREQDNAYKEHTRTHEKRSIVLSRFTLIVTAAYFVVTGLIFCQSKRSADAAKSAAATANKNLTDFEAVQAAQVSVEFAPTSKIGDLWKQGQEVHQGLFVDGNVDITNIGQTSANDIIVRGHEWGRLIKPPPPGGPPTLGGLVSDVLIDITGLSVGAGKTKSLPLKFNIVQLDDIRKGLWQSGVDVDIDYRDVFGRTHSDHECFVIRRNISRDVFEFTRCPKAN